MCHVKSGGKCIVSRTVWSEEEGVACEGKDSVLSRVWSMECGGCCKVLRRVWGVEKSVECG